MIKSKCGVGGTMTFNLSHARHDAAHCLAPGLFQSFKSGDRKKLKLDITYDYGNNSLRFMGFEPLNDVDLRVLQGLVAMAGPKGVLLDLNNPKTEDGRQLSIFLDPKFDAIEDNAMVVKGSFYSLAKEIGYKSPNSTPTFKIIRESIERLWSVSIIAQEGGRRRGFKLLADYCSDEGESRLFVALNPLITEAILGERKYTHINMDEVRALKSSPARLIHQRLCGFINAGNKHLTPISIDTLGKYVWIDTDESAPSPDAIKKRKQAVRKAIKELVALGWGIEEKTRGNFTIRRP